MARNQEKAQSMLNRWLAYKRGLEADISGIKRPTKRPTIGKIHETTTVAECEGWRLQIIRDVGRKIMEIQNESMGEQRLKDLNDEINQMLKEKHTWENRILELGGPNYRKMERIVDDQLSETQQATTDQKGFTYKYFGAARNLPGVKELLEKSVPNTKKMRKENRGIDADYYGYRDEEDGVILNAEKEAEKKSAKKAIESWDDKETERRIFQKVGDIEIPDSNNDISQLAIPSKQQMETILLDKRKQDLMKKYVSEELKSDLEKKKQDVETVLGKRKQ